MINLFQPPSFQRQLILFAIVLISLTTYGQQSVEEKFRQQIATAKSDSERIISLGRFSKYQYAIKNFVAGDSLIEKQIMLAESTLKQNLVLMVYFGNAGYLSTGTATKERAKNTEEYIRRALEYAKANDFADYTALAYSNLATLNNSNGLFNEAFKNANLAFTTALNTNNDSAKVVTAIQLGNIYQQRSDVLMAFKTFMNAQNIAILEGGETLLPLVYHAIAGLYKKLGKEETAKRYIHQSLAINKKNANIEGQVNDNIFLAKLNNYLAGKEYLQQAVLLADSVQNVPLKIEGERILFYHMLFQEKPSFMLAYLDKNHELRNVFINSGPGYINWILAEINLYGGLPDSALFYFNKAEPYFKSGYDPQTRKNFLNEYAYCYTLLNKTAEAIAYYQQSYELSKTVSDLAGQKNNTSELKKLYQQQGDFEQAFTYSLLYDHLKDTVELLGKEKDLALLEIENEAKLQQREIDIKQEKQQRQYNLQYMLITIVVATAFLLMIMIGMFKVSTTIIRLMGFLSLLFFFEFIILLLDTWIHHLTHGEPWKIWLIKIGIISLLLPLHHFLEHKLIHYLLSRHLITVRSRFSISKLFKKKKKVLPPQDATEEQA